MTVRAKKSLGQHFLFDTNILKKMIRLGKIVPELPVLEIGPGPGELTATLLAQGCFVCAVEFDRDMIAELKTRFAPEIASQQLHLIQGDILKQNWEQLLAGNKPWQVVGNIPYNISTEIIFRFIDQRGRCECGMFMVQKEVAARICAKAGSKTYGVLSIGVQLATRPKILFDVGRKSFVPPPKVDSSIIYMDCLAAPFPSEVYGPTMTLVKTAFQQRRKTLKNALLRAGWSPNQIETTLNDLKIPATARPEVLSPAQWVALTTR
jgi:16S rRNA (adenine1518-N6/adenine1519-N6)-dimethyltransferase